MSSPYKNRHTANNESDQKDIVISQLKAAAFELHQSEKGIDNLGTKLTNLNHRFNLLQKEKALDEKEYNNRNELYTKTIQELKEEVNALRAELEAREGNVQALVEENDDINKVISTRTAEVARLKCELGDLSDENKDLNLQINELEHQINDFKADIKEESNYEQDVAEKVEEAHEKKSKNEKLIKAYENDVGKLLKENDDLKTEQNQLRLTIRDRVSDIKDAECTVSDNNKRIVCLESRLNDCTRVNEKINHDIAVSQKEQKQEGSKAAEQTAKVADLEDLIQEKDDELEGLRRQLALLRKEELEILEENDALEHDVNVCNKHLGLVTMEHYQLLDEVERINEEDEGIRRVLQRDDRISETKSKYEDKMRSSQSIMTSSLQSPTKTQGCNSATSKGSH